MTSVTNIAGPSELKVAYNGGYIVVMDADSTELFRATGGRVTLQASKEIISQLR